MTTSDVPDCKVLLSTLQAAEIYQVSRGRALNRLGVTEAVNAKERAVDTVI